MKTLSPENGFLTPEQRRAQIEKRIGVLQRRARTGLWGILSFVLVSVLFAGAQSIILYDFFSLETRKLLGAPPPANLVSLALAVYSFSALTILLARMAKGAGVYKGWPHLGYLAAFYLFYWAGNSLKGNFWAVFIAGLTILGLEHYRTWSETQHALAKEKELLYQFVRSASNPS